MVALQPNRSLVMISISNNILAALEEHDQGRLFCSLRKLHTLQQMTVNDGAESHSAIHTQVLADALSETSNGIKILELTGLKISSQLEVEQLGRGLKARFGRQDRLSGSPFFF
jgi:hypothetical protein